MEKQIHIICLFYRQFIFSYYKRYLVFVYMVCIMLIDYRQLEHGISIAAMLVVKRLGSSFIASKNPGQDVYI